MRRNGFSFAATLAYLGDHHSTDPRDRIYALGGLVKDFELAGVPSYVQPLEILYANLVQSFVERYRSLDIICFATVFSYDLLEYRSKAQLPSWVPDWRVIATLVCPLMVSQSAGRHIGNFRPRHSLEYSACYSASHGIGANISFSPDLRELQCEGILLDFVDALTSLPDQDSARSPRSGDLLDPCTSHGPMSFDDLSDLDWHGGNSPNTLDISERVPHMAKSIMRCLVLNREDHYLNHMAPEQAYMEDFANCLAGAVNGTQEVDIYFWAWFKVNRSFHANCFDLQSLAEILIDVYQISHHNLLNRSDRKSFISRFHDTIVKMARRLVISNKGIFCMAPKQAIEGDVICVLFGCSVLVVLRQCADTGVYKFIGECYVDGYMNGEAIRPGTGFEKKNVSDRVVCNIDCFVVRFPSMCKHNVV